MSVAIPTYKSKYLRDAIDSILNQDYQNIELIIVNDKSPEDIDAIVKTYNDNRIRYYVNEKNLGGHDLAESWDKCLSYAKGEFFCLLCDDDMYKPTFISQMLSLAEQYEECGVFRGRCELIDSKGNVNELYASCPTYETCYDYMYHVFCGLRRQTVSEFLYRTTHIRKSGGYVHFPLAWHSDYFSTFSISRKGGIVSSNEVLVTFRMSGDNISSHLEKYGLEKAEANFMAYRTAKKYIEDADGVLKPLLESSLEVWKTGADKRLISALSFNDKLNVIRHRKQLGIPMRTVVIAIVVSIYNKFL